MAITWTNPDIYHAVGTATTGTETTRPTGVLGLYLGNVSGIGIHAESPSGTIASGNLRCWMRNAATGLWNRAPDLDITIPATALQGYYFVVSSPGPGLPAIDRESYAVWVPDTVTAAAGITVYLNGTPGGAA